MNNVKLALNICTYKRENMLMDNLQLLRNSDFFDPENEKYYEGLEIFVIDNASEIELEKPGLGDFEHLHLFHNPNTGGSGGFQRGIEEIRKYPKEFTHVIFMDDDAKFKMSSFYILYDFLQTVDAENADRPVAGRMFDIDNPNIQWTAAEKWNAGNIQHVEFQRDITDPNNPYTLGKVVYDADADYGGFWFCCYPYSFVKDNDILPFFLHCDDVEYGLRCGKSPIIIEGVQVWHKRADARDSRLIRYYDRTHTMIVNNLYGLLPIRDELIKNWIDDITEAHIRGDYDEEYLRIIAFRDYLIWKRFRLLHNNEKHNIKTKKKLEQHHSRYSNVLLWREVLITAKKLL